jgi:hypothetical protein
MSDIVELWMISTERLPIRVELHLVLAGIGVELAFVLGEKIIPVVFALGLGVLARPGC